MQLNRLAHWNGLRTRRLLGRGGVIAILAMLVLPVTLLAHAHLRRSDPTANARLESSPTAIRLWFTERPELPFTRIKLRAADSTDVPLGALGRISDDALGVWVPIPTSLAAGTYTVIWRTAAADGHATTGSFTFVVASATKPVAAATDTTNRGAGAHTLVHGDSTAAEPAPLNVSAATRWVEFIAMLAVVGAIVFRFVVLRLGQRALAGALSPDTRSEIADSVRRLAQGALVLLLVSSLSRLYEEASTVLGPDRPLDRSALATILLGTSWGLGWLLGIAGILVAGFGFIIAKRSRTNAGWAIAALGALAIVMAPALTGHARATQPVGLALLADMLHVCAACAWIGGLMALLFAALPIARGSRARSAIASGPLVAGLVRAFHPVALTCAAIVIVTGLCAAWLRLPAIDALWTTSYGRVLLIKLAFVAIVVLMGAINWRRMLPSLGDDGSARRITRTAGTELTFAVIVLAVTAVLVSTSPPESIEHGTSVVAPSSVAIPGP
ncbi:MAG TPA: CopD family protein [Gemmatimonadaceae bacterium]|nr:CopD family protein [Gemmatimonadaceae bacterium]